jgi:hypothetical protein
MVNLLKSMIRSSFLLLLLLAVGVNGPLANAQSGPQLERLLKRFPEADANGDGVLTQDEAQAYRRAARSPQNQPTAGNRQRSARELTFDPGWDRDEFPEHAVSLKTADEIMAIYKNGPEARGAPSPPGVLSYPEPKDGGMRIVGVGHSFMAPGYKTLPLITKAAGFEQPMCLHTGGGVTGSARYKWEQENGIFEFDGEPVPKLLAAISNADWEAMLFGAYYSDRPKFYTCWIEFCMRYHPDMKFYLADAWPQLDQLEELYGIKGAPESEDFLTDEVLETMATQKRDFYIDIVTTAREQTTERFFILPTNDAVTLVAKMYNAGKLPQMDGLHKAIGGNERSVWRDYLGHIAREIDRLEGYVFYAALYGKSPELIKAPIVFDGDPGYPDLEMDQIFRRVAWLAVVGHPLSGVVDADNNKIGDHLE